MQRTTIICDKCNRSISRSNYNKHYQVCDGTYFIGPVNPNKKSSRSDYELYNLRLDILQKAREKLKGKPNVRKGTLVYSFDEVFCINGKGLAKKYFMKFVPYECSECKISKWNNKPITLQLHHINGNNKDNRFENLCLLCPNCHTQTDTYSGKTYSGYLKVTDEQIISAYKNSPNIRQALRKLGLGEHSTNYKRVYKVIEKYNL